MKNVKFVSGLVLTHTEVTDFLAIINKMVVYSDNAVALKREFKRALREGKVTQ